MRLLSRPATRRLVRLVPLLLAVACSSSDDTAQGETPDPLGTPPGTPPGPTPGASEPGAAPGTVVVTVAAAPTRIIQGRDAKVSVVVARGEGLTGSPVEVRVTGLLPGITAAPIVIPPGTTTGELTVAVTADTPQGPSEITVAAKATTPGVEATPTRAALFVRGAPGSRDTTFGTNGHVALKSDAIRGIIPIADVLPSADGKTTLVGSCIDGANVRRVCVARLDANGALDPTFKNGSVGPPHAANEYANSAAFGAGGSILVFRPGETLRLLPDGSLDTSFGTGGVRAGPAGSRFLIAPGPGGTIVAANSVLDGPAQLMRFTAQGDLDPTFGSGGIAPLPFTNPSFAGIGVGADGHVFAGIAYGNSEALAEVRFVKMTPAGAPDEAFGPGGVRAVRVEPSYTEAQRTTFRLAVGRGIVERGDGSLVVGAAQEVPAKARFVGVTSTGGPDSTLGTDGRSPWVDGIRALRDLLPSGTEMLTANRRGDTLEVSKWTPTGQPVAAFVGAPFSEGSSPLNPARLDDRITFATPFLEQDWATKGYVAVVRIWD